MAWQTCSRQASRTLGTESQPSSSGRATLPCLSASKARATASSRYCPSRGLQHGHNVALRLVRQEQRVLGCPRAVAASAGWLQSVFGGSPAAVVVPAEQEGMHAVNEAELEDMIAARGSTPLLIVFTAPWCGPCKMLYNNLKRVSADLGPGSARIVSVDVEDNPGIASQLKVQKLPTLLFLGPHDGRPAVRMQGPVKDAVLKDILTNKCQNLGDDMQRAMLL